MKEIWKDVKDYEGLYQVSNLGREKNYYIKLKLLEKAGIIRDLELQKENE